MTASTIAHRKLHVRSRGVFGRELHVVGVAARLLHGGDGARQALLARDVQLLREVQVGCRDERVDARPLGALQRLARALDVFGPAAGERRDDRAAARSPPPASPLRHRPATRWGSRLRSGPRPAHRAAWRARTFSLVRSEKPGACSPSRRVVSKIVTRSVAMLTVVRHSGLIVKSILMNLS